jgi:hypothetical protein
MLQIKLKQLIDKITVGGKLTDVVYQFQKAN